MHKPKLSTSVVRVALLFLGVAVAIACATWSYRGESTAFVYEEVGRYKKLRLDAARMLNILEDNKNTVLGIHEASETVESLTLSLMETITQQAQSQGVDVKSLSIVDNAKQIVNGVSFNDDGFSDLEENDGGSRDPKQLRVDFIVGLDRAGDLLSLFDVVQEVATWRPIEIRACSLSRRDIALRLSAACTVDVYYFPGIDT